MRMTKNAIEMVREMVEDRMGFDFNVETKKVNKNNDVTLTGIIIMEVGSNIAPTIYLDEIFKESTYLEDVISEVIRIYNENQNANAISFDPSDMSYEKSRDLLTLKLVSANQDLKGVPHRIVFDDLAVIMVRNVSINSDSVGTIKMTDNLFEMMGREFDELYELALANTERIYPSTFKGISEIIFGVLGEDMLNGQPEMMYVLTNEQKINGCVSILYNGMIDKLTDKFGDFIMIPSSIHEVIIVPFENGTDVDNITQIVREVNGSEVSPDEVLSDRAYIFHNGKYVR